MAKPIRLISLGEENGDSGWCETTEHNQGLEKSNRENAGIEDIGEFSALSNPSEGSENANPGALAGATGADQLGISFKSEEYRKRAEAAIALCHAIAECEPEDAIILMEAALYGLSAGAPDPVFLSIMGEADEWAAFATVAERKAWCLACFNRLPAPDRAAFLAHVTGGGHG